MTTFTEDQFKELEKGVLDAFQELAPLISAWIFNHPKAKNYFSIRFNEPEDEKCFDIIIQRPTKRRLSCPWCHGNIDAGEKTAQMGEDLKAMGENMTDPEWFHTDKPVI